MSFYGTESKGTTPFDLAANVRRMFHVNVDVPGRVAAFSLWMDGQGSGSGAQVFRPVIYTEAGDLVAVGDETTVADGAAAHRVSAPFIDAVPGGVELEAGDYLFGVHGGPASATARLYGTGGGETEADAYAGGPAATTTVGSSADVLAILAPWFPSWVPPSGASEELYARLPFEAAEVALGATIPQGVARRADSTWHWLRLDGETGAFAIVQTGGPFAGLVGKRIRVSGRWPHPRAVDLFVHSEADLYRADISLTRRAFAAIHELPIAESAPVAVYVLQEPPPPPGG